MSTYVNATLIKLDENNTVTIDGTLYFVMMLQGSQTSSSTKPSYKEAAKSRPTPKKRPKERVVLGQVQPAVLKILAEHPELKNNDLKKLVEAEFKLKPADSSFRNMLRRMKDAGLIEVHGIKNAAKWSLKRQETPSTIQQFMTPSTPNSVV